MTHIQRFDTEFELGELGHFLGHVVLKMRGAHVIDVVAAHVHVNGELLQNVNIYPLLESNEQAKTSIINSYYEKAAEDKGKGEPEDYSFNNGDDAA